MGYVRNFPELKKQQKMTVQLRIVIFSVARADMYELRRQSVIIILFYLRKERKRDVFKFTTFQDLETIPNFV